MSEHTNCWCAGNVVRCSLPGCPRLPRYRAEQEERRKWEMLSQVAQAALGVQIEKEPSI